MKTLSGLIATYIPKILPRLTHEAPTALACAPGALAAEEVIYLGGHWPWQLLFQEVADDLHRLARLILRNAGALGDLLNELIHEVNFPFL